MKIIVTRSVIAVAALLFLSIASCKNDPEVNIPLIDYILIGEEYLDAKSGQIEYNDSLAMLYNADLQLIGIDGFYQDYDIYYDNADRVSKVEITYNQTGKALYSSYIEFTWTGSTVTAQEYYGPGEPTYYKAVYTFDGNDRLVKVEHFAEPNKGAWYLMGYSDFTWTNNNLTKYEEYEELSKSLPASKHSFSRQLPGQVDLGSLGKGGLMGVLVYEMDIDYDNNTNPFVIYPALTMLFAEEMPHIFASKNNPTFSSNAEYYEGTFAWDTDFYYEFNDKGFPVVIEQTDSYDGYSYLETWFIGYK